MTTVFIASLLLGSVIGFEVGRMWEQEASVKARLDLLNAIEPETPIERTARAARDDADSMERQAEALLRSVGLHGERA